jgi:hypothetical protein
MVRLVMISLLMVLSATPFAGALAQSETPVGPQTFELTINGEKFRVQVDYPLKLQSRGQPGTSYDVSLRVAGTQSLRLNKLRFDYEMPARVTDDGGAAQRVISLKHDAGFTFLLTDLGQPMDAKDYGELLKGLAEALSKSFRAQKVEKLTTGNPTEAAFERCKGQGIEIRYDDAQGQGHTCRIYVVGDAKFTATCVIQYAKADEDEAWPLAKKTLDSLRGYP